MIHVWQRRRWLVPSTPASRCRHPAPGQDLILLQRLHVFAQCRDPHPAIKLWCQLPFTKSKTIVQIEMYWKANILKVELSMIKIGELLRKLWSLRSCFLILPSGALTSQGMEGAMKRDVSKHWCTLQWCASGSSSIAHENWTLWWKWYIAHVASKLLFHSEKRPGYAVRVDNDNNWVPHGFAVFFLNRQQSYDGVFPIGTCMSVQAWYKHTT